MACGYTDNIKCPLCQHEFTRRFGITHYYHVEQLGERYRYTEVKCPACKETFWHAHKKKSVEKYDDDDATYVSTVCY